MAGPADGWAVEVNPEDAAAPALGAEADGETSGLADRFNDIPLGDLAGSPLFRDAMAARLSGGRTVNDFADAAAEAEVRAASIARVLHACADRPELLDSKLIRTLAAGVGRVAFFAAIAAEHGEVA